MSLDIVYIGFVLGHGGDAAQMLDLADAMQRRGNRVRIVVPQLPTTELFATQCLERGVEVERSGLIRADPVAPRQVPEDLRALFQAYPDSLLHLHTGDVCLSRTVPAALRDLNIVQSRVFVTVHSAYDTLTPGDARSTAWADAARSQIQAIVCPSRHSVQTQMRYGVPPERVVHIANGVNLERFKQGNGAAIRSELGLEAEDPLLLFCSRLDSQKRPMDAIDAFEKIAFEFPMAHIAFVGSGELEGAIRGRTVGAPWQSRVHFAGHRNDIADWLAASTVWLLPTETENFSLGVLEALAAGCAILSTLCRGNNEVLVPDQNAVTHAIGDSEALADGLRRLLNAPELRSRISSNARETSQAYSTERMVDHYHRLYLSGGESH